MNEPEPVAALKQIAGDLTALGKRFCVVGGFGVSIRGEVRFTRDVDVAVDVGDSSAVESLVRDLRARRYEVVALVEQDEAQRVATVRLRSPSGVVVDLLTASSGIEPEIVARASTVEVEGVGAVPVAQAEELLSMKVLSMDDRRLQDRIDASTLLSVNEAMDLHRVRENLRLITSRGYHREQDLLAKLEALLTDR